MTDDEKIKLVATMTAILCSGGYMGPETAIGDAIFILEETIKQLKEKGMIKDE